MFFFYTINIVDYIDWFPNIESALLSQASLPVVYYSFYILLGSTC